MIDGGYWVTVLVLVVLFSPTDIRLMRSAVMTQATRPYIESARVLGLSRWRIMFRHILPNVLPIAFATMLLNVAFALVAMSALSFLGLGVGPGEPDWGRQLSDGRDLLSQNAAAVIVPGVLIIITAATINLLGDWIQERFNAEAGVAMTDALEAAQPASHRSGRTDRHPHGPLGPFGRDRRARRRVRVAASR